MVKIIAPEFPAKSIVLGWSLGGLVATRLALDYADKIPKVVFVASSPCFIGHGEWAGIRQEVLDNFRQQLTENPESTVGRFIALQAMGAPEAKSDVRKLKAMVASLPQAVAAVLDQGLAILQRTDLRPELRRLTQPVLRIYGALDSLVPRKSIPDADLLWPQGESVLVDHAAHAPFISHPAEFCELIKRFCQPYLVISD